MPKIVTIEKHLIVEQLEQKYPNTREVTDKIHLSCNFVIGQWWDQLRSIWINRLQSLTGHNTTSRFYPQLVAISSN